MDFVYLEDYADYEQMLDVRIKDCICKHVLRLGSDKANKVYQISESIGYQKVIWGYGQGLSVFPTRNKTINMWKMQAMIYDGVIRPVRLVIDKNGVLWVDNLHTAIKDILVLGDDTKLSDIIVYIVDMRTSPVTVVSINDSVVKNFNAIVGAIKSAKDRLERVSSELYDVGYTIGNFMEDNEITLSEFTLTSEQIDKYKSMYIKRVKNKKMNRLYVKDIKRNDFDGKWYAFVFIVNESEGESAYFNVRYDIDTDELAIDVINTDTSIEQIKDKYSGELVEVKKRFISANKITEIM